MTPAKTTTDIPMTKGFVRILQWYPIIYRDSATKSLVRALGACAALAVDASADSCAPAGWADELTLSAVEDRNPDPAIVEIDLSAKLADVQVDGKTVQAWTYNGGLPGPLI